MKCKRDFVTNSSSTSYIFESDCILIGYENVLDRLESEDKIVEILEDIAGYCGFDVDSYEKELMDDYNFTSSQLNVMKVIIMNEYELYKKLVSYVKSGKFIYCANVEDDYLFYNKDLYFIINNSNVIDRFS